MASKIKREAEDIENTVTEYERSIFKIAFSYTKDKEGSEDILQNVLIKYMTSSKEFHDLEHKKAWIIKVTINECKKHYRSLQFQFKNEKNLLLGSDPLPEEKHDVYYAVMDLPKKYRIVVHLYYYEQLSVKEISTILNVKENTVMSLLHRSRQKLKKLMEVNYGYKTI